MREPVFIKNLETVQGDQRDAISPVMGQRTGAATMSMSFARLIEKVVNDVSTAIARDQ
jgi:hypothetical protein